MSANILANCDYYLWLVRELLAKRVDGAVFAQAFMAQRRADLAKDDEITQAWPKRYDIELLEGHAAGKISDEEFTARWHMLWRYPVNSPFLTFFGKLFTVVEAYEPDIEVFEMPSEDGNYYFHDEDELRHQVADLLAELEREAARDSNCST